MSAVMLWDGQGLRVSADLREDGSLVIRGQDLRGDEEYEYAIEVDAVDLPTVAAGLGVEVGDLLPRLVSAGATIVREGERSWLRAHGIEARLWSWGYPPVGVEAIEWPEPSASDG